MESWLPCYDDKHQVPLVRKEPQTVVPLLDNSSQDKVLDQILARHAGEADQLLEQGFKQQKSRQFESAVQSSKRH
jgi:hypothetical protein